MRIRDKKTSYAKQLELELSWTKDALRYKLTKHTERVPMGIQSSLVWKERVARENQVFNESWNRTYAKKYPGDRSFVNFLNQSQQATEQASTVQSRGSDGGTNHHHHHNHQNDIGNSNSNNDDDENATGDQEEEEEEEEDAPPCYGIQLTPAQLRRMQRQNETNTTSTPTPTSTSTSTSTFAPTTHANSRHHSDSASFNARSHARAAAAPMSVSLGYMPFHRRGFAPVGGIGVYTEPPEERASMSAFVGHPAGINPHKRSVARQGGYKKSNLTRWKESLLLSKTPI